MSGLTGQTKQLPNVNVDAQELIKQVLGFFSGQDIGQGLFPSVKPTEEQTKPYTDLFRQNNAYGQAQAKETAGNLTGSGFANILGNKFGEQQARDNAFLANLFETRRMQDANRFAGTLLGALNSNAAAVSNAYQPGFLDYGVAALGAASPYIAAGGGGAKA